MSSSLIERIVRLMPEPKSTKDLRSFGLIVGGIFGVIALWPLVWRGMPVREWALLLAVPLMVLAVVFPRSLRYPYRGWMFIGHCLGWVNVRILMTLMFYGVFTPAALVMRVIKRDAMNRRLDPSAATYRVIKSARPPSHVAHPF
jgi:hypothetical protein